MTTSVQKDALLSQFAALAYRDKDYLDNQSNLPPGWKLVDSEVNGPFAGFAFQNEATGEVIVAYRGTDGLDDGGADAGIALGNWNTQFKQGIDFLKRVRDDVDLFPSYDSSKLLVTGHSLGGAIAQVVAQVYGLDGSTIDPGAAESLTKTPEFQAAALAAVSSAKGLGIADSFTNYLVVNSLVSGATGPHLGKESYLPSLTLSGEQALTAFLIGVLNPVAGFAYAVVTDQFSNKHSSEQMSQALELLAGAVDAGSIGSDALVLSRKIIDWEPTDPITGQTKPIYSQDELEIRNQAGELLSIVKFSGSGAERQFQVFDATTGELKSTTTLSSSGAVTVKPVTGDSVTVSYATEYLAYTAYTIDSGTDGEVNFYVNDGNGNFSTSTYNQSSGKTITRWRNADGSYGTDVTNPNGSHSGVVFNPDGTYQRFTDDGKGNVSIVSYDNNGKLISGDWWKGDGSRGSEIVNSDNTREDTIYNANGKHAKYTLGANSSSTTYDAQGNFISSEWSNADDSYGRMYTRPDGILVSARYTGTGGSIETFYYPNGVVSQVVKDMAGTGILDDGEGTRIVTEYGPDGLGVVSNTIIQYNPDGSGTVTVTDGNGRETITSYGPGELGPLNRPDLPSDMPQAAPEVPEYLGPVSIIVPTDPPTDSIPLPPPQGGPEFPPDDPIPTYPPFDGAPDEEVHDDWENSRHWVPRRDPLVLDLDNDGVETVPVSATNPILFDLDADGIKAGTGWIKSDDGFLALDRDGNGLIDDGSELFGDATPLAAGGVAADGLAALADLDGNADGKIDARDSNFSQLRIWRDLNQDGISQSDELSALGEQGITAINLTRTAHSQTLGNGNQIADQASFERSDGTEGGVGTSGVADVNLAVDNFHREYTDTLPLSDKIKALPDMKGSGQVRDLRAAESLSEELADTLAGLAGYHTRAELLAQADAIIAQWAASAEMQTGVEKARDQGRTLVYLAPGQTIASLHLVDTGGGASATSLTADDIAKQAALALQQARITGLVGVLERFNGETFVNIENNRFTTGTGVVLKEYQASSSEQQGIADTVASTYIFVSLSSAQVDLLQRSYNALKQSVYDGLVLQTRLKPYLDLIGLQFDGSSTRLAFTAMTADLGARHATQPADAVRDLLDIQRMAGVSLGGDGWDGYGQLRAWLTEAAAIADPSLRGAQIAALTAGLADFGYPGLRINGDGMSGDGMSASEVVIGAETGATLNGEGGNDLVLGGTGDDTLNGGSGNDVLYGGAGNDTYVFNLGDGSDAIVETHGDTGTDTLQFGAGMSAGDFDIYMDGDKLVFGHISGRDKVSVANWFNSLSAGAHRLDVVSFSDGTVFDFSGLQLGTADADTVTGTDADDILMGGAGNDLLDGGADNDWLNGGTGADTLVGGTGNDIYVVDNAGDTVVEVAGEGNDTVDARISYTLSANVENLRLRGTGDISGIGNELDNTLLGNSGNNALYGMAGNDTLISGAGHDLLDGGAGDDVMAGGIGDDAYVVDSAGDTVVELAGQGTDTVYTGLTYTLGANIENLALTGSEAVVGTGNELSNVLTGNAADNILMGLSGNDVLDGGAGADTLIGGTGNDTYVVDNLGDQVIEETDEGIDTVKSSITYSLTADTENLTLTGAADLAGTRSEEHTSELQSPWHLVCR